jgi:hypothetical protein
LFCGVAENTFVTEIGLADPRVIDYISELMLRFVHLDVVHRLRSVDGRPLTEVAEMMMEAEEIPASGRTRREYYRHIGDYTLFWTGLFPEAIKKRLAGYSRDALIDYTSQGKRYYKLAGEYTSDPYREEAEVLTRLSDEYELCAAGLNRVRQELGGSV